MLAGLTVAQTRQRRGGASAEPPLVAGTAAAPGPTSAACLRWGRAAAASRPGLGGALWPLQ